MSRRTIRASNDLGRFAQQYGRKAQRGIEPNDRKFSKDVARSLDQIKPEDLSALLNDDSEELVPPPRAKRRKK